MKSLDSNQKNNLDNIDKALKDLTIINKKQYKLQKDCLLQYQYWLKANHYARNTMICYHKNLLKLLGDGKYITLFKIKKFLNKNNNIVKQSSVKSFILFLENEYNMILPSFRYNRIKKEIKVKKNNISRKEFYKIVPKLPYSYRLFSHIVFELGLRASECSGLRVEDFNWDEWINDKNQWGSVIIRKTKGNKERILFIKPSLMNKLYRYAPRHEGLNVLRKGFLWDMRYNWYIKRLIKKGYNPEYFDIRYINKIAHYFIELIKRVGREVLNKDISPHTLRHSRASELDSLGIPATQIRDILGHESISTTNIYLHNKVEQIKNSFILADNKLKID